MSELNVKFTLRNLSDSASCQAWDDISAQYAIVWSTISASYDTIEDDSLDVTSCQSGLSGHLREPAEWAPTPHLKAIALPDMPISPISALPSPLLRSTGRATPGDAVTSTTTASLRQDTGAASVFASQQTASLEHAVLAGQTSLSVQNLDSALVESRSTPTVACGGLGLGLPGVLSTSWSAQAPLYTHQPAAENVHPPSPGSQRKLPRMRSLCNLRGLQSPRLRSPLSPKSPHTHVFTPRLPFGQSLQNMHTPSPVFAASPVFDDAISLMAASHDSISSICLADELEASFQDGVLASPLF
ncbi:hypothetical protein HDZ31DRAFT_64862 [Schizophyllum fasciatum]